MKKNRTAGLSDKTKGRAKEATGKLVGNKTQELKGHAQNMVSKAQVAYADIKESFKLASKYQ